MSPEQARLLQPFMTQSRTRIVFADPWLVSTDSILYRLCNTASEMDPAVTTESWSLSMFDVVFDLESIISNAPDDQTVPMHEVRKLATDYLTGMLAFSHAELSHF